MTKQQLKTLAWVPDLLYHSILLSFVYVTASVFCSSFASGIAGTGDRRQITPDKMK